MMTQDALEFTTTMSGGAARPDDARRDPGPDVIVIGGGVVGAATAYFLARDPAFDGRVVVLEQDPTYARSATALSASSIRQQFSTAINVRCSQFGIEFLRRAANELAPLAADEAAAAGTGSANAGAAVDIGLVERTYLYLATGAGRDTLTANVTVQRTLGVAVELETPDALQRRYPWLDVTGLAAGAWTHAGEGWFDAYALLQALRRKGRALGVEYRSARVTALERGAGATITRLQLDDGSSLSARWFICVAGTGTPRLLKPLGLHLPVGARKRTVYVFDSPGQIESMPLLVDPSGFWCRPEGASYLCGMPPDPDPEVEPDDFAADGTSFERDLWPLLAARVPGFEAARCARSWVGHYDYNAFDQNAFVGPVRAARNLLIACGFSGHGLQQAPAVGRGLAELVVHGGYRSLDLSPLDYERYLARRPLVEINVI
jgi:glycine/D-amino acid oxidase-like deaminating enzyme